jgi:hypothetical protein
MRVGVIPIPPYPAVVEVLFQTTALYCRRQVLSGRTAFASTWTSITRAHPQVVAARQRTPEQVLSAHLDHNPSPPMVPTMPINEGGLTPILLVSLLSLKLGTKCTRWRRRLVMTLPTRMDSRLSASFPWMGSPKRCVGDRLRVDSNASWSDV